MDTGITLSNLNLRSAPGLNSKVIALLPKGTEVTIMGKAGRWICVETEERLTGFLVAVQVTLKEDDFEEPEETLPPLPLPPKVSTKRLRSCAGPLSLRSAPGVRVNPSNRIERVEASAILMPLDLDETVAEKLGNSQDQWIHVRTPSGAEGYVAAWLVTEVLVSLPVVMARENRSLTSIP